MKKQLFIITFAAILTLSCTKQARLRSYSKDIDFIIKTYENNHPGLHPDIEVDYFKKRWEIAKKKLLVKKYNLYTNGHDFYDDLMEAFHILGSGHDKINYGKENESPKTLPVRFDVAYSTRSKNAKKIIYIDKCWEKKEIRLCKKLIFAQVLAIDNIPIDSYIRGLLERHAYEIEERGYRKCVRKSLHVQRQNKKSTLKLKSFKGKIFEVRLSYQDLDFSYSDKSRKYRQRVLKTLKGETFLYIKIPEFIDRESCLLRSKYLGYRSSYCKRLPDFQKWMNKAGEIIRNHKIKRVIIDLRDNNGGYESVIVPVLKLVASKKAYIGKFTFSRGDLYYSKLLNSCLIPNRRSLMLKIFNNNDADRKQNLQKELQQIDKKILSTKENLKKTLYAKEKLQTEGYFLNAAQDLLNQEEISFDILSNSNAFSAAEIALMTVYYNNLGRIIGEPPGNGCCVFTNMAILQLPESRFKMSSSMEYQTWPDEKLCQKLKRVPVNIFVRQSYWDKIRKIDSIAAQVYGIKHF